MVVYLVNLACGVMYFKIADLDPPEFCGLSVDEKVLNLWSRAKKYTLNSTCLSWSSMHLVHNF